MTLAVGTVVGRNYVPFARVLADSIARHHAEIELAVVVADEVGNEGALMTDLGVADLRGLSFRCTRRELVVALKPFLLEALLKRAESALFLDADILVLEPLDDLIEAVQQHALTLFPHTLSPGASAGDDLVFSQSGAFNGGVVGVSRSVETSAFLAWWQQRLAFYCRHDVAHGLHFDQRWLDFAPVFVRDTRVYRDPTINVAHWNLRERRPPFRLFHFSGFEPDTPEAVTRYRPELRASDLGLTGELFRDYGARLLAAGWERTRRLPYAYERFANGVRIPTVARRLYAELPDAESFGDPFADGFFNWLRKGQPSPLWRFVHGQRPDLQNVFPDPTGRDRRRYQRWIRRHGAHEYGVPSELV